MSITIGHTTFDRVRYDSDADTLYRTLASRLAVDFDESPRVTLCVSTLTESWSASRSSTPKASRGRVTERACPGSSRGRRVDLVIRLQKEQKR